MYNEILIYSLLSFFLLFVCARISYKLNLIDLPSQRKIHIKPTANTGGLAIIISLLFALQALDVFDKILGLILSIGFLISIVGLIDDKFHLNTGGKLSLQIIPIFYLIVFENLTLNHIGTYNSFVLEIGSFTVPFTLLCVLFLTNAFNYFDGMDGTLSFTTISVLIILYFLVPDKNFQTFLIMILMPIIIFLCFNFSLLGLPKLFLGDSGSLLLGFIISFILIYLANLKFIHPLLLAWSIAIFVYEFLSINIIRLKNKQNPFKAGTDHLHHRLFEKNKSIFLTNFLITSFNIILFLIGYLSFLFINEIVSLILFVGFFIIFLILRNNTFKKNIKIKF
jgi:UDP-GlcNAc:undecaprenyl-phosphate/decaprenyl-phosphate GlcNAc-1-phosphate transferase